MVISIKKNCEKFFPILALGLVSALQQGSITIEEAWNWGLNLNMLKYIHTQYNDNDLANIIHLGTELDSVKRIIPQHFDKSCEDIIGLCHEALLSNKSEIFENDYYLSIE